MKLSQDLDKLINTYHQLMQQCHMKKNRKSGIRLYQFHQWDDTTASDSKLGRAK